MKTAAEHEIFTIISKEAELLSSYAWLAVIATDPQAKQDSIDATANQWRHLQHLMAEALPEVAA